MRVPASIRGLGAVAALALLAGCSNSGSTLPANNINTQSHSRDMHVRALTGVAPQFLQSLHIGRFRGVNPNTPGPRDLAVSDLGTGADEVLDHNYALEGTVTDATFCPDGNFYDRKHRLYNADYCGSAVTEYDTSGNLMFTYSASGLSNPVGVTVDSANNVYAADYGGGSASIVVEFPQGNSTPSASCSTGLANEGVAVDSSGAVFVSGNNPSTGVGTLLEYPNGLAGCPTPTTLGATLGFAGGLQVDHAHNLVACDQNVGVDIIPPPYSSVSSTITGAADTFHVAINKKNGKIFIADPTNADVLVDLYPSGAPFMVLNSANGLSDPASVAVNPYK
jgi:DNA-binding beta-propeller fold protein YncE